MRKLKASVGVGIELERVDRLREKLLAEIARYEFEQSQLRLNGTYVNFTLIQTYTELIASRKDMLHRLPLAY